MLNSKKFKFSPGWISGFTQADGTFLVSFEKINRGIFLRPRVVFSLTQSSIELPMFRELQNYLMIGNIQLNKDNVLFTVSSLDDILNVIIPLFDKHPVRAGKLKSYLIFKQVALMLKDKKHLTIEGLLQILFLSYFSNETTTKRSEESLSKILTYLESKLGELPKVDNIIVPTIGELPPFSLDFVIGLIEFDGSFNVSFKTSRRRVVVNFTVVQDSSCFSLLNDLVSFFSCGKVYSLSSAASRYQVESLDSIVNNVIPLFKGVTFNTIKQTNYIIVVKVCEIIKRKGYKADDDFKAIIDLAYDMNCSGKRRRLSKDQFINKMLKSSS
jgi:hypothetical protein